MVIFALIWIQRVLLGTRQYTTITGRGYQVQPQSLGSWRSVTRHLHAFHWCHDPASPGYAVDGNIHGGLGFFDLVKVWTTRHWTAAFNDPIFLRSLTNTVTLGLGASIYQVLSFICWFLMSIVRTQLPGRKFIDILSWLPWALPGVLISLALLWVVLGSGGLLRPLYGTIFLLVLAMIIKEMPLGSQIIKASVLQMSNELEEASFTSGASWVTTFRRIMIPLLTPTLSAVGIIVFIAAVREFQP